jgi:hypothetical protein
VNLTKTLFAALVCITVVALVLQCSSAFTHAETSQARIRVYRCTKLRCYAYRVSGRRMVRTGGYVWFGTPMRGNVISRHWFRTHLNSRVFSRYYRMADLEFVRYE